MRGIGAGPRERGTGCQFGAPASLVAAQDESSMSRGRYFVTRVTLAFRGKALAEYDRHCCRDNAVRHIGGVHHVVSGRMSKVCDKFAAFIERSEKMPLLVLNREVDRVVCDHAKAAFRVGI